MSDNFDHSDGRLFRLTAASDKPERRHGRRAAQSLVLLQADQSTAKAILTDISESGAGLHLTEAVAAPDDGAISIRLLDGTELKGQIVRATEGQVGIQFELLLLEPETLLTFEHLGYDFYRSIIRFQRA